jgi:invasion protein IalB
MAKSSVVWCTPEDLDHVALVPRPFRTIEAMKKGKKLTVASLNLNNGEVVAFKISLEGFAAAAVRVAELAK